MNLSDNPWLAVEAIKVPRARATRPLRVRLYTLLFCLDLLCIVGAFVAGALLRFGTVPVDGWTGVTASVAALFAVAAVSTGAYSLEVLRRPSLGTARAVGSVLLAFALLFLLFYFLKVDQRLSRIMTGSSFVLALIGVSLVRQLAGDTIQRVHKGRYTTELLLNDGPRVEPENGMTHLDAAELGIRPDPRDASMLLRVAELFQGVDRVVVSCPRNVAGRWAKMLKGASVQGEILTKDYDHLGPIGVAHLGDHTTLIVSAGPLNVRQRAAKRAFDLALTVPVLILLAPVLALVAVAIKLDSRGPVLFKQRRVGYGNALFEIFKFRTMEASQTDAYGHVSTRRNDPRITRVGKFLRRTSIDELPQLFNVLLGSMSIVGPRPHALGSLAGEQLFWHVDERYWHRHVLKPGITGLAQVKGFRGATNTREDLTSRLQADLQYISGWSLWRDISIVARTVRVLVHPQAY